MSSYPPSTDGFLTCPRCGSDVAEGTSFCAECGAPQNVAMARAAGGRRSGTPAWLIAVIVAGGIAALGAGALLAIIMRGTPDQVAGDPSPSAGQTPAVAASASNGPSKSAVPTASPEPTLEPAAVIPNLGLAAIVTDSVSLRAQPNESAGVVAELGSDWRLFVIGEPTEAGDLRWYRVATVASPTCTEACEMIGYVATPIEAGDPWIEEVGVTCPISPMTLDDLGALQPLERLHCYGRNEIVVTGTVADPTGGYDGPFAYSPEWLAHPFAIPFLSTPGGAVLGFRPHPDAGLEPPEAGDVVRVTGHFEDQAATSCRASVDPAYAGEEPPPEPPAPALVVLTCRATFAWTDYEVIGP
jgi:hypothetical protein